MFGVLYKYKIIYEKGNKKQPRVFKRYWRTYLH
nr:MAG TPA: hypothetical protein [Bacteriophage sp.]